MADARRRLRSGTVVLGGMGVLAAALSACSSDPDKRCVDRDSYHLAKGYKVVADKNCGSTGSARTGKSATAGKSTADNAWYYGGEKKGSWVDGGSFAEPGEGSGSSTGSTSGTGGSSGSGGSGSSGGVDRNGFGSGGDGDGGSGVGKGSSGG
ncbi:hypothetical protein J2X68_002241 [Streptomyces sp. 3330]|uniref:hypothetical protein n=1 Tax=Streptomyces sp. 3330 TaxID=2817755 RepID=UPI0028638FA3|nr:hypothetical protein [Streptomyces sp. 3330]MDR6975557.1 hypothetical protein [Streptomyces sp. 3330]